MVHSVFILCVIHRRDACDKNMKQSACHFRRTHNSATSPATLGTLLLHTILSLSIQRTVCSTFVNTSHFLLLPALCVLLVVSGENPLLNGPPLPASLCKQSWGIHHAMHGGGERSAVCEVNHATGSQLTAP